MIGQKQTIFGEEHGNCFAACLASILERPIAEVPNFCDVDLNPGDNGEWYLALDTWLDERYGLSVLTFRAAGTAAEEAWVPRGYSILSGRSPRGEFDHSVVALDGEIVFDPHPSDAGLVSRKDWIVFTVRNPARGDPMIPHFDRGAARAKALQERRQIAAEAVGWPLGVRVRLTGRCSACGRSHGLPDERIECSVCGREACFGGCGCGREG